MAGVNKVILIGNVGQDPECRTIPTSGKEVAQVSLATSETWKDQNGQRQERTEWHRVVFFGPLAGIVRQYVKKGSKLYVEGQLRTRKWQDQNGQDRYTTEIVAREMKMLDARQQFNQGGYDDPADMAQQSQRQPQPQGQGQQRQQQQRQPEGTPDLDEGWDDDIPF